MKQTALRVENISKLYQLGVYDAASLKNDLMSGWGRAWGSKMDSENSNQWWALKNVDFELSKGDVVGIIGKNGSGKSTLLKIISRITQPTTGSVKGNGRVSSLLEVGTGFQPELTGKENIYLNGMILGMKKKEVARIFDAIVDFSGVEKFLDTPVKRYSSGMYVRLAFSVASHLNSETLIIDEALTVGDSAFQEKCMAKMKEISSEAGKTVIIVSHHLEAVRNLCKRALWLKEGVLVADGNADDVVTDYMKQEKFIYLSQEFNTPENAPGNEAVRIKKTEVVPQYGNSKSEIDIDTPLKINLSFWNLKESKLTTGIRVHDIGGACVLDVCSDSKYYDKGIVEGNFSIPAGYLRPGCYYVSFDFVKNANEKIYSFEVCLTFDIRAKKENKVWTENRPGFVRSQVPFMLHRLKESTNVAV
ncbi:MAG TPA: polysaccharide ABC transporter ATP-binding protein [Flavipsychrobacter sp.]|nr:polysaccharide ABC transporter ATP-binding protein [Flavipsychrobacter sp.]